MALCHSLSQEFFIFTVLQQGHMQTHKNYLWRADLHKRPGRTQKTRTSSAGAR